MLITAAMLIAEGPNPVCVSVEEAVSDLTPVVCVHSADEARTALTGSTPFLAALIDLDISDGRGAQLAADLCSSAPHTKIILYGANPTVEQLEIALNSGTAGFLRLPFNHNLLRDKVRSAIAVRPGIDQLRASLKQQTKVMHRSVRASLLALAKLAEHRDTDTGMHVERVSVFSVELATLLRQTPQFRDLIDDEFLRSIQVAAALHDIGKVAIPDEVLRKPGRLTDEEFALVKTHSMIGWQVIQSALAEEVSKSPMLRMAAEVTRSHHERWDGSGYPDRLAGVNIPLSARIVSVIDAYDAMRSRRVYNPSRTQTDTVAEVERSVGSHFEPAIAEVFLQHVSHFEDKGRELDRKTARWK